MVGQLLPVTERLLQFAEILHFTALILVVQVGISPFDAVLGDEHPFYSAAGVHTFSAADFGFILPF